MKLVRRRGALMQEAVPEGEGAMAAVMGLDAEAIARVCAGIDGVVAPANFNSPVQTVIAGRRAAVAAAGEALLAAGAKRVIPLDVSAPFHCELMASAMEKLTPELAAAGFRDLRIPVDRERRRQALHRGGAGAREAARAGLRAGALGRVRVGARRARARGCSSRSAPARCSRASPRRSTATLGRANVEKLEDLEPALAKCAEVPA